MENLDQESKSQSQPEIFIFSEIRFPLGEIARRVYFTGHGSQVTGHGSQVTGHRSRVTGHRSRVTGHGSRVTGRGSRVTGRGSRVAGHRSRITGLGLFTLYTRKCLLYIPWQNNRAILIIYIGSPRTL